MIAEPVIVQDRVLRLAIIELTWWADAHDDDDRLARVRVKQIRRVIAQLEKRREFARKKPVEARDRIRHRADALKKGGL